MKTIYIDSEYRCHAADPDGIFRDVHTSHFDGKCQTFIEGYRYIPAGENWTSESGDTFVGEMVAPWKDYAELDAAQRDYEKEKLADAENALAILLGGETV